MLAYANGEPWTMSYPLGIFWFECAHIARIMILSKNSDRPVGIINDTSVYYTQFCIVDSRDNQTTLAYTNSRDIAVGWKLPTLISAKLRYIRGTICWCPADPTIDRFSLNLAFALDLKL